MTIEYAYARIRGRRAKMLKPLQIEAIIKENLENLENLLKETRYGKYLQKFPEKTGLERLIRVINSSFIDEVNKVKALLSDEQNLLYSLETYLSRWDLQNFISVVRGKFYSHPSEEILYSIFPVGILDDVRIKTLLKEESAYSVAERVKTVIKGLPFDITREALKYLKEGDLARFEYEVYTSFYSNILSRKVHPAVIEFYKCSIDAKNISLAIISLQNGEKPSLWLEGGHFEGLKAKVLKCESLEELQKVLLESLKIRAVKLEGVDILFEKKFLEDVRRRFRVDPVSFYSVMDYINDLERESATLRVIAYAKSFGLTPEQIREVLYV